MWQDLGIAFKGIKPNIKSNGNMYVTKDGELFIFDQTPPVVEYQDFDPPATLEEANKLYIPTKKAWMEDFDEILNRNVVRLFKSKVNEDCQKLFEEKGQKGFLWKNEDVSKIYILTQWRDYKHENEKPYLNLWKSIDGGNTFSKADWNNHLIGRGEAFGIYFDMEGVNGYIFLDKNTLLQTSDGGSSWRKIFIPYSDIKPWGYKESSIDAVTVDNDGNLLFALFDNGNTQIYEVPHSNKETDLSQVKAKYSFKNKRLFTINILSNNSLYFFYLACDNSDCNWYDENQMKREGEKNKDLRFSHVLNGDYITDLSLGFFLPINKVWIDNEGKIAVKLKMTNAFDQKLLLSSDYGKKWTLEDITRIGDINGYIDPERNEYWQYRKNNKIYMAKDIFK